MPDINTLYYHGIRHQLRRVLNAMTEDQIDKGLTAFEDGASNWSQCFFARALAPARLRSEYDVVNALSLNSVMPVRILYTMFDQIEGSKMTSSELYQFISSIRDETRPDEVMKLLQATNFMEADKKELSFEQTCA